MNKAISWFLGFTKVGKLVESAQKFLSGKKAYIAGTAMAVPAVATIISNFTDNGVSYLIGVVHTPEWALLLNGLGIMGIRAAITKAADTSKDPNAQ